MIANPEKLKQVLAENQKEEPKEDVKLNQKALRRLTRILTDSEVNNVEKNKMARTIFKEIIKGGEDGKRIRVVFWR